MGSEVIAKGGGRGRGSVVGWGLSRHPLICRTDYGAQPCEMGGMRRVEEVTCVFVRWVADAEHSCGSSLASLQVFPLSGVKHMSAGPGEVWSCGSPR